MVEVTNRFKRLNAIDRVPEELWMEVRDIVQEAVIKTIPKKKKCKKAEPLSAEAFKRGEKREVKGNREKERYIHRNAVFQRMPIKDNKGQKWYGPNRSRRY